MKSNPALIREVLQSKADLSAQEVAAEVKKVHNVTVTVQQVYNTRNDLKKKRSSLAQKSRLTRSQNAMSLSNSVLAVLVDTAKGLTSDLSDREIADKVKANGYISNSPNFFELVRVRLYELVEEGAAIKQGTNYWLKPGYKVEPVLEEKVQRIGRGKHNETDLTHLVAVSDLLKKIGGEDKLQSYLEVLRKVS